MTSTTSSRNRLSDRWLLAGLLAGPLIWSHFFLIGYGLAETACFTSILLAQRYALPVVIWIILALAAVSLIATAYAGVRTYRSWQSLRTGDGFAAGGRAEFLALSAVILNILFGLSIVITAASVLLVEPCDWI